jgi:hypothetical protein
MNTIIPPPVKEITGSLKLINDDVPGSSPLHGVVIYPENSLLYGADVTPGATVTTNNYRDGLSGYTIDDNIATNWCTNWDVSALGWLLFQLTAAKVCKKYTITVIDSYLDSCPKNWTLYGSNDGVNFTALDSQVNQINWTAYEKRSYIFSNSTAYLYYKLDVTANNGRTHTNIAEVELMEATYSSELKVRDEAGNITTLSPHNLSLIPEEVIEQLDVILTMYSRNEYTGKELNIDLINFVRDVEALTKKKYLYINDIKKAEISQALSARLPNFYKEKIIVKSKEKSEVN